jgi:hypothetical protein
LRNCGRYICTEYFISGVFFAQASFVLPQTTPASPCTRCSVNANYPTICVGSRGVAGCSCPEDSRRGGAGGWNVT